MGTTKEEIQRMTEMYIGGDRLPRDELERFLIENCTNARAGGNRGRQEDLGKGVLSDHALEKWAPNGTTPVVLADGQVFYLRL